MWLFFSFFYLLLLYSQSCFHLPALLLQLKMPPLRMKMKSASAHLHPPDTGSCFLSPGASRWWWEQGEITCSLWQVVGAAMWWEVFLASFTLLGGRGFSSAPAGAYSQLLSVSSQCRVSIPARLWLAVGLQLIFSWGFVITLRINNCVYNSCSCRILVLSCHTHWSA